jgi:two-component system chemotaxis response regulator CheB
VDVVAKPELGVAEFLRDSAVMLADAVYAAAHARVARMGRAPATPVPKIHNALAGADSELRARVASSSVIAIGASTGGPPALSSLLGAFPADAPGCVIVQHMPAHFTSTFARRLNEDCRMEVREARGAEELVQGLALIAPGNRHLLLHRRRQKYVAEVAEGALVSRHRPSVDALFRSVARAAGPNGMGVILTGMGSDGAEGLREMKKAGAFTFSQDEATSVVFGMPKEAIERGGVDEVAALEKLPAAILNRAYSRLAEKRRR